MSTSGAQTGKRNKGSALILATGWRLQYRALRCAAPCFESIHVLGPKDAQPLAWSLLCKSFQAAGKAAAGFTEASIPIINELCARRRIDFILPSDGETTLFLANFHDRLTVPSFPVPDAATFATLNNKLSFATLCQQIGVLTPQTQMVAGRQELLELMRASGLRRPMVAKPLEMWGGYGVQMIQQKTPERLVRMLGYEPILLQEYVAGSDLCAFFFCRAGQVQAEAVYRFSPGCIHFEENAHITKECEKIIHHCAAEGVIGFDMREGVDGRLYFLECNPRFWYNMEITMLAGLNFVEVGLASPVACVHPRRLTSCLMPKASGMFRLHRPWRAGLRGQARLGWYYLADIPMALATAANAVLRRLHEPRRSLPQSAW